MITMPTALIAPSIRPAANAAQFTKLSSESSETGGKEMNLLAVVGEGKDRKQYLFNIHCLSAK